MAGGLRAGRKKGNAPRALVPLLHPPGNIKHQGPTAAEVLLFGLRLWLDEFDPSWWGRSLRPLLPLLLLLLPPLLLLRLRARFRNPIRGNFAFPQEEILLS